MSSLFQWANFQSGHEFFCAAAKKLISLLFCSIRVCGNFVIISTKYHHPTFKYRTQINKRICNPTRTFSLKVCFPFNRLKSLNITHVRLRIKCCMSFCNVYISTISIILLENGLSNFVNKIKFSRC